MKKLIFIISVLTIAVAAYAVESSKPEDHNASWEMLHGKKANTNSAECYMCHTDRLECITCHEDSKPRSHTMTWTNKTHGLEARWERTNCKTCHTEDSCISCHDSTLPSNHKVPNFLNNSHCSSGYCQLPVGTWRNTIAKDCIICHTRRPVLNSGALHSIM